MKEEVSELSPLTHPTASSTPRAQVSPGLTPEIEAARQQLTSMIQGLPLLSMLPALHRLAPGRHYDPLPVQDVSGLSFYNRHSTAPVCQVEFILMNVIHFVK